MSYFAVPAAIYSSNDAGERWLASQKILEILEPRILLPSEGPGSEIAIPVPESSLH